MIFFLEVIRFAYPFFALFIFSILYRNKSKRMCRFYYSMALTKNGTRLFASVAFIILLFFNWCSYICDPGLPALISGAFVFPLAIYRLFDLIFQRLHDHRSSSLITLAVATVCYAVPALNCIAVSLFLMALMSVFYPSRKVMSLRDTLPKNAAESDAEYCKRIKKQVIEQYY